MPDMTAVRDEILMRLDETSCRYVQLRLSGIGPIQACEHSGLTTQRASALEDDADISELLDVAAMSRPHVPVSPTSGHTSLLTPAPAAAPSSASSRSTGSFFSRGEDGAAVADLALRTLIEVATSSTDPKARTAAASALLKHAGRMAGPRGKQAVQRLLTQANDGRR